MKFKLVEIKKIDSFNNGRTEVYDLTVEKNHSFCITSQNIIVHNSVCDTRHITGIGRPQFSALMDCVNYSICSDGGCKSSGDIAKAFGIGARYVMIGSLLAGCNEGEYDDYVIADGGVKLFKFYGMSSKEAMEKHYGEVKEYRASEGSSKFIVEQGPVRNKVLEILGGLRSACSYTGNRTLDDFIGCVDFYQKA